MTIHLAGGASTQSRARRPLPISDISVETPLPLGATSAQTLSTYGPRELVEFSYSDGRRVRRECVSWLGGQAGLLFGAGPYPWEVQLAITRFLSPGSYPHYEEHSLAEALGDVFDGFLAPASRDLSVRFFQDGGDACSSAARVARFATGRDYVAGYGYHGAGAEWAHRLPDDSLPGGQIEENTITHLRFDFGDVKMMRECASLSACLMVEVPAIDDEAAIRSFLAECRSACDNQNIPLIFDDVVSGFRLALAGTSERYGVKPDIVVLGKAMSATGCVSALLGDAKIVDALGDDVFYSTTFGGHPWACSIANATVRYLHYHAEEVFGKTGWLSKTGTALKDEMNKLGVKVVGQPERSIMEFPTEDERLRFCSEMAGRGVLVDRPFFPTLAHSSVEIEKTLDAAREVLKGS